jgi:hypothetical protein
MVDNTREDLIGMRLNSGELARIVKGAQVVACELEHGRFARHERSMRIRSTTRLEIRSAQLVWIIFEVF